jgi:hypothetical protein
MRGSSIVSAQDTLIGTPGAPIVAALNAAEEGVVNYIARREISAALAYADVKK